MVKYYYENDTFVIEDYQKAKTFASFLPAVAGYDGKPLWAFYANVGQCMGGFGVNSKETPITPFDSANLAYQNIPLKSFRSFVRLDGKLYTPFFRDSESKETMYVNKTDVTIVSSNASFDYKITYSTVPHHNFAGLIRHVTITSKVDGEFEVVDGVPVFFPNGLSNFCYKELVSLMAAYCTVEDLDLKTPFVKFKTSTGDNSQVSEMTTGNGFYAVDEKGEKLPAIIDLVNVFGEDLTLIEALGFKDSSYADFTNYEQQTENKLPCAFNTFKKHLKKGESYSFVEVYGMFDNHDIFKSATTLTYSELVAMISESKKIVDDLLSPCTVHTSNPMFDMYAKQTFLDNNLRGGFPCLLDDGNGGQVYYVYGRKHGDMERDYNSFIIPSKYYSSGTGNFRDVNQNRRNDLFFAPYVKDYNIVIFFNLIQADGQNPLNVKPLKFVLDDDFNLSLIKVKDEGIRTLINDTIKSFEPSTLYTLLRDNAHYLEVDVDKTFSLILRNSHQVIEANFAEGYWVDHWTYNVDLLENYESVYPDLMEELLFSKNYKYFYSPVYVNPRVEKYSLLPDGKVRQYGAIDLKGLKKECERLGLDITKTYWLKDSSGKEVVTTLASKIYNLILVKFSTLDSLGLGIEMECEKPGWNDAMNGLPGLFASGLSETVELLRLVKFAQRSLRNFLDKDIEMLDEQLSFHNKVVSALSVRTTDEKDLFNYWNLATSAREEFRKSIRYGVSGKVAKLKVSEVLEALETYSEVLKEGIKRAKDLGNGIIPSYLVYEVSEYVKTGHINHLGYETVEPKRFNLVMLPPFLEASARALKLGKPYVDEKDHDVINETMLYDPKLHFYKTCADIDDAPFEIGRVHAFTKGWLERECNFVHMTYKYLLGLLKAGFYDEFYEEAKTNFIYNMDVDVYGRSILENSSFIVPTCNPDTKNHGRGFFARLTGANAEFVNMLTILFLGAKPFTYDGKTLSFRVEPKLKGVMFDEEGIASFTLFGKTKLVYHNPLKLDCYKGVNIQYKLEGQELVSEITGQNALDLRNGKFDVVDVYIGENR